MILKNNLFNLKKNLVTIISLWMMATPFQPTTAHGASLSCEDGLARLASTRDEDLVKSVELYRLLLESKILFGKAHEDALTSRINELGPTSYLRNFALLDQSQKDVEGAQIFNKIVASFSTAYDGKDSKTLTIQEVGDLNYRAQSLKLKYEEFMTASQIIRAIVADPLLSKEVSKIITASVAGLTKNAKSKDARGDRFDRWKQRGFGFIFGNSDYEWGSGVIRNLGHLGLLGVLGLSGVAALTEHQTATGLEMIGIGAGNLIAQASYVGGRSGISRSTSYLRKLNAKRATKKFAAKLYKDNQRNSETSEE